MVAGDLSDWMLEYPRWEVEFEPAPGVLLVLLNLKLRPLRLAFLRVWRANVGSMGVGVDLLYKAMAAASAVVVAGKTLASHGLPDSTGYSSWQQQCNSQTGFHHGSIAFLRRWGLLVGDSRTDAGPLRVVPQSASLGALLGQVLSLEASRFVTSLQAVGTLDAWVAQVEVAASDLVALGLPGLSGSGDLCTSRRNSMPLFAIYFLCQVCVP